MKAIPMVCLDCAKNAGDDPALVWCPHERALAVKRSGSLNGWTIVAEISDAEVRTLFAKVEAVRAYRHSMARTAGAGPEVEKLLAEVSASAEGDDAYRGLDPATRARIDAETEEHLRKKFGR